MIQRMLAVWSLVPLPFLKPAWISGSSRFTYCRSLASRILNITSMWDECNYVVVWAFFGITFLWDWNEISSPPFWSEIIHSLEMPFIGTVKHILSFDSPTLLLIFKLLYTQHRCGWGNICVNQTTYPKTSIFIIAGLLIIAKAENNSSVWQIDEQYMVYLYNEIFCYVLNHLGPLQLLETL